MPFCELKLGEEPRTEHGVFRLVVSGVGIDDEFSFGCVECRIPERHPKCKCHIGSVCTALQLKNWVLV